MLCVYVYSSNDIPLLNGVISSILQIGDQGASSCPYVQTLDSYQHHMKILSLHRENSGRACLEA